MDMDMDTVGHGHAELRIQDARLYSDSRSRKVRMCTTPPSTTFKCRADDPCLCIKDASHPSLHFASLPVDVKPPPLLLLLLLLPPPPPPPSLVFAT